MANIRQRRLFPVSRHDHPFDRASFGYITSQTISYSQPARRLRKVMRVANDRTRLLKRTGRWTHVRRVIGREFPDGVRYDWYGFHNGWDATTQTYEADMVRPVQGRES